MKAHYSVMAKLRVLNKVHLETAGEFVDTLSPFGEHFRSSRPRGWIFRGHGDAVRYKLLPTALRPEETKNLHALAQTPESAKQHPDVAISQWLAEARLVSGFASTADRIGLSLPEQSSGAVPRLEKLVGKLDRHLETVLDKPEQFKSPSRWWPEDDFVPLIALAQHHRLPTCFLDWTYDPYVAAYFAARDAIDKATETIGIWALQATWFSSPELTRLIDKMMEVRIGFPQPAKADNPNLLAQSGIFLLCSPKSCTPASSVDRTPFEERLQRLQDFVDSNGITTSEEASTISHHFTMHGSEANELLWYLDKVGVDAARLFPGYDGVAQVLRDALDHRRPQA